MRKHNLKYMNFPRFARSESTPELHRVKKLDSLLLSTEKSVTLFKSQSILLDTNVSNFSSTVTSDVLPEIFRKPITQQSDAALNYTSKAIIEEKVSKWGYGPSAINECPSGFIRPNIPNMDAVVSNKDIASKCHVEAQSNCPTVETPKMLSKYSTLISSSSLKLNQPLVHPLDKPYTFNSSHVDLLPSHFDKDNLNQTVERKCNISTSITAFQATVKCPSDNQIMIKKVDSANVLPDLKPAIQPVLAASTKSVGVNISQIEPQANQSQVVTSSNNTILPSNAADVVQPQPLLPKMLKFEAPAEVNQKVVAHTNNAPILAPNRPRPKSKQIHVNGKVYTVMKPLGRGGSSIVYQVWKKIHYNITIAWFNKYVVTKYANYLNVLIILF